MSLCLLCDYISSPSIIYNIILGSNICYSYVLKFDFSINLRSFLLNAKYILLTVKLELIAFYGLLTYF